jgi:transcriptional regulator with XRE-family HTH domain
MTQPELARLAKVAERTLMDFESGARTASRATRVAIAHALQEAGVDLLESQGVALREELEAA